MARKKKFDRKQADQNKKPDEIREKQESKTDTNSWNDVSWYTHFPELIAASARVPFPYRPGMEFKGEKTPLVGPEGDSYIHYRVPGVCQLRFDWTIGVSADTRSPASLAAFQMWRKIRRAYSGSLQADPPDVMMYALALDQIYAYISYLKRIYRTITTYDSQNMYLPDVVLSAEVGPADIDPLEFAKGKVALWNGINRLVRMVSQFKVPSNLDIFKRHSFMCEHVYADAPMVNSQLYVFAPSSWYVVREATETGTYLEHRTMEQWATSFYEPGEVPAHDWCTIDFLLWVGNTMLEALLNWDDAHTINGYIMRAFEGVDFYTASLLMEDESLMIDYVPEVLLQIHNATLVSQYSSGDITQDPLTGAIIHAPNVAYNLFKGSVMLDMPNNTPSEPEIVLATRLVASVSEDGDSFTSGTEVVNHITVFYDRPNRQMDEDPWIDITQQLHLSDLMTTTAQEYFTKHIKNLFMLNAWSSFPRIPFQFSCQFHEEQVPDAQHAFYVSEVACPSVVSWDVLRTINETCMYSEFDSFA